MHRAPRYEPIATGRVFGRAFQVQPGTGQSMIPKSLQTFRTRSCEEIQRPTGKTMKIKNSLKALKARHRDNRLVRRKGRIYIINKTAPRYKARQG